MLRPPVQRVPPAAFLPLAAVTAGLLPASLRLDYELRWGRPERLGYRLVRTVLPRALRLLPRRFRQVPPARRMRAASSTLGSRTGRSS